MNLIIDFLLLAASGAACFYCWVLNKRLRALTSSKKGIAEGIAALSQSAEDMQAAMSETSESAGASVSHLESLLEQADAKISDVHTLQEELLAISKQAVSETEAATEGLIKTLSPYIAEARESAGLLFSALEKAGDQPPAVATASASEDDTAEPASPASEEEVEIVVVAPEEDKAVSGEAA